MNPNFNYGKMFWKNIFHYKYVVFFWKIDLSVNMNIIFVFGFAKTKYIYLDKLYSLGILKEDREPLKSLGTGGKR